MYKNIPILITWLGWQSLWRSCSITCLGKHSVDIFVLIMCVRFWPTWSHACMARCGRTAQQRHILKADMWYSISFLPCLLLISCSGWSHATHGVWCAMATVSAASRWPVWRCLGFRFTDCAELNLMCFLIFLHWNKIVAESFTNQRNLRENTVGIRKCQNGNECRSASWHLGDYKWITAE